MEAVCRAVRHHTARWRSWSSCTSLFSEQRHIFTATKRFSIKHASAHIQCKHSPPGWPFGRDSRCLSPVSVATTGGERKSDSFIVFIEQNMDWFHGGRKSERKLCVVSSSTVTVIFYLKKKHKIWTKMLFMCQCERKDTRTDTVCIDYVLYRFLQTALLSHLSWYVSPVRCFCSMQFVPFTWREDSFCRTGRYLLARVCVSWRWNRKVDLEAATSRWKTSPIVASVKDEPSLWNQHHWHGNVADGSRWNIELHNHF